MIGLIERNSGLVRHHSGAGCVKQGSMGKGVGEGGRGEVGVVK